MSDGTNTTMTRRELLQAVGTMAAVSVATPLVQLAVGEGGALSAQALPLNAIAGVDRVVMNHGKTYLNGWVGYGEPPRRGRGGRGAPAPRPKDPPRRRGGGRGGDHHLRGGGEGGGGGAARPPQGLRVLERL